MASDIPSLTYANQTLSNLTSPTALNQALIFSQTLTNPGVSTPATTGSTAARSLEIQGGNAVNALAGQISINGGSTSGSGTAGTVQLIAGSTSSTGQGGNATVSGGSSLAGQSGTLTLSSGSASSNPGADSTQGNVLISTDGNIQIQSNDESSTGTYIPSLQFWESTDSFYSAFKASNSLTSSTTWTLPLVDGTNGQFLKTNGSGILAFASAITALTGDVTATASGAGSVAATLATVNTNTGSFGSSTSIPNFTVNGKGLITAAGGNVVIAPAGYFIWHHIKFGCRIFFFNFSGRYFFRHLEWHNDCD